MIYSYGVTVCRRAPIVAAALALLSSMMVSSAARADNPNYVLRNGQKVPMTKSLTEFGLVFHRGRDIKACRQRLESSGQGIVRDLPGAKHARVKILQVAHVSAQRRSLVRQDPDVESVLPVYRFQGVDAPVICTGEVLLRWHDSLNDEDRKKLLLDYRVRLLDEAKGLPGVVRVIPIDDGVDDVRLAEALASDWRTVWAQPNLRRASKRRQVNASDEFFSSQWHLNNTGQLGGSADADIDAVEAWVGSQGQGVTIGMFDDACDVDHEDLNQNYLGIGHDPSLPDDDPGSDDPRPKQLGDNHGTQVMGLAVAAANSVGGRGVAFLSQFTASRGLSDGLSDFNDASVFTFARQQSVDVHLNSWGEPEGTPNSAIIEDAIRIAFEEGRPLDDDKRGMVIVWAAGNQNVENLPGFDYSTLPEVIGVGASSDRDERSSFSNWGVNVDVVAPGGSDNGALLTTTDNEDVVGRADNGVNVGGFEPNSGFPELDSAGSYTENFIGTSASCPIVAGIAALILSRNPQLKATDVRLILQHTADPIDPGVANYHGITSRSVRYGYGRVNAAGAVSEAANSLNNGGFSWPERVFGVNVSADNLSWVSSVGTREFLVVEGNAEFEFVPTDGRCYDDQQAGCGSSPLTQLPAGVSILSIVKCVGECELGSVQSLPFQPIAGTKHFAIFGRNQIGRYAFGVAADTTGLTLDEGPALADADGVTPGGGMDADGPRVTVAASPLEGNSPLTVEFNWNAISALGIDTNRTQWIFDTGDPGGTTVTGPRRPTTFEYVVAPGQTKTFTAQLTMFDVAGNSGSVSVLIRVNGPSATGGGGGSNNVAILAGVPGSVGLDVDEGTSPFSVMFSIDATALDGSVQSIRWNLGDGNTASSFDALHTYENATDQDLVLAVTATVTFITPGGASDIASATRFVTVKPGTTTSGPIAPPDFGPTGSNGDSTACGAMGLLPLFAVPLGLTLLRCRRF